MVNNCLSKDLVQTTQQPKNEFSVNAPKKEIKLLTPDFSPAARRGTLLAKYFQTGQSARAENTIYLCGIY